MDLSKLSDLNVIAATICAEAGGEHFVGQVLVGEVIANRAIQSGTSPRAVCLAPKQFSAWNNYGTMELRMQTMQKHPAWAACVRIAKSISHPGYVPVSPVTHYYAWKKIKPPKWAKGMMLCAIVGGHQFYKSVEPATR